MAIIDALIRLKEVGLKEFSNLEGVGDDDMDGLKVESESMENRVEKASSTSFKRSKSIILRWFVVTGSVTVEVIESKVSSKSLQDATVGSLDILCSLRESLEGLTYEMVLSLEVTTNPLTFFLIPLLSPDRNPLTLFLIPLLSPECLDEVEKLEARRWVTGDEEGLDGALLGLGL